MKYFFLFFTLTINCLLYAKSVCLLPLEYLRNDRKVEEIFIDPVSYRDEIAKPFCRLYEELEKNGYHVTFVLDNVNIHNTLAIISFDASLDSSQLTKICSLPKERCFLFSTEPPVYQAKIHKQYLTQIFDKIFILFDDIIDNQHYYKFYYPQPRLKMIDEIPAFDQKKFCTLIAGNKASKHSNELYSERLKVISFYGNLNTEDFDLYGSNWKGYSSWKGPVSSKWDVLKNYKFNYCYENMKNQNGYITEKILDSFIAGCVPIYWGASNITDYIPADCFIDRRAFSSEEELYIFLRNIDRNSYESYLEAVKCYFASSQAQLFSIDKFINIILEELSKID